MTATTTLKLPDDLKERIAAAEHSGKSPHAFRRSGTCAGKVLP